MSVLTMREASRKYDIPISTLSGWVHQGVIRTERAGGGRTSRVLLEEEDVALASKHYIRGRGGRGRVSELKDLMGR